MHASGMMINKHILQLKKVDLKDSLISDWEEKKRKVENDKLHMELAAGETYQRYRCH